MILRYMAWRLILTDNLEESETARFSWLYSMVIRSPPQISCIWCRVRINFKSNPNCNHTLFRRLNLRSDGDIPKFRIQRSTILLYRYTEGTRKAKDNKNDRHNTRGAVTSLSWAKKNHAATLVVYLSGKLKRGSPKKILMPIRRTVSSGE